MHDPRTKIELPSLFAVVMVGIFIAVTFAVSSVAHAKYAADPWFPYSFGATNLFFAACCAVAMRSITREQRPAFPDQVPIAVVHRLPGHIARFRGHRVRIPMPDYLRGRPYVELDEIVS